MWNDKVEATPKTSDNWVVPALFVILAAIGAVALVVG